MAEIIDCTKCAFYNNGKCDNPNGMSCNCINNAICYYKELKRLEQENAELKEKLIKLSEEKGHLIVKNNTLEEANQSLSLLGTTFATANEIVRKEFFRADKNKDMWREKAENLQQTLQEIKVLAEKTGCRAILDIITKFESEEE